jgi:hypothetical protein
MKIVEAVGKSLPQEPELRSTVEGESHRACSSPNQQDNNQKDSKQTDYRDHVIHTH